MVRATTCFAEYAWKFGNFRGYIYLCPPFSSIKLKICQILACKKMTTRLATVEDYDRIAQLFRNTILKVNIRHYSPEQVRVWSDRVKDKARWLRKITDQHFLLVENEEELIGCGSITPDGYLDMMYVSHRHQGKGIARHLVKKLEAFAREQAVTTIRSDVSLTARPFFERMGFRIVTPQKVEMDGLIFDNFVMEREL